jgi:hypothetical protein
MDWIDKGFSGKKDSKSDLPYIRNFGKLNLRERV